jgi:hypothetical protein
MESFVLDVVLFQVVFVSCIGLFAFRRSAESNFLSADETK